MKPWSCGLLRGYYDNMRYSQYQFFYLLEKGFEFPAEKVDALVQKTGTEYLGALLRVYPDVTLPDDILDRVYRSSIPASAKHALYNVCEPSPRRDYMIQILKENGYVAQ